MTAGGTMGTKWRRTKTKLNWSIIDLGSRSTATTAAVQKKFAVSSLVLHGQQWLRVRQEVASKQFPSPDRAPTCWRRVVAGRFHFGAASRPQLRWSTTASWVGDSVIAARSTLSKTTRALNMLKGTDGQHAGVIAFLKRVFGSRSTAGRVATPQDLSVTKQHRNDRWDRCTASAGDWQIITTTSHRSANQRYFMHISATVHRMRMQSSALDSSRSQLCNDTSTGVVRHQITKWRRLQKVVSYDVLHHTRAYHDIRYCSTELRNSKIGMFRETLCKRPPVYNDHFFLHRKGGRLKQIFLYEKLRTETQYKRGELVAHLTNLVNYHKWTWDRLLKSFRKTLL